MTATVQQDGRIIQRGRKKEIAAGVNEKRRDTNNPASLGGKRLSAEI